MALTLPMKFSAAITRMPIPHDPSRGAEARAAFAGRDGPVLDLIAGTAGCSP